MNEKTQIQLINDEVNLELNDEKTVKALIATTFKGLDSTLMKQAIIEGMMRGFTFKNFLQKDIYALPFNTKNGNVWEKTYSLATSIDLARKIGQKAGQIGKGAPIYEFNDDGSINTCSVTVKKLVSGQIGDYTATVYFNEFSTGKNLWVSKPKMMIAKVAEMHALRSAFPEELGKIYVEEEFDKGSRLSEVKDEVGKGELNMGNFVSNETKDKDIKNQEEDVASAANPFRKKD